MTSIKDKLDDETLEEIEEAKTESKRSKTKYGSSLNDE
jgi:hypothetical protein